MALPFTALKQSEVVVSFDTAVVASSEACGMLAIRLQTAFCGCVASDSIRYNHVQFQPWLGKVSGDLVWYHFGCTLASTNSIFAKAIFVCLVKNLAGYTGTYDYALFSGSKLVLINISEKRDSFRTLVFSNL